MERADGRFEVVWSVEAEVVRLATDVGRQLVADQAPQVALPPPPPPLAPTTDAAAAIRRATAITNRVIAHLDTRGEASLGPPW